MQIPIRVDYAARAVIDLAQHQGEGPVRIAEIAQRRGIPESFLDQVLLSLRKAGTVRSTRGAAGGYELARPPEEITVGQVMRDLGDEALQISCMQNDHCTAFDGCVLEDVWRKLADCFVTVLEGVTIAELVRREEERRPHDIYFI